MRGAVWAVVWAAACSGVPEPDLGTSELPAATPAPTPEPLRPGVELRDPARASPGQNLVVGDGTPGASWRGLDGAVLRSVTADPGHGAWVDAVPTTDGGVVALTETGVVLRVTGTSKPVWQNALGAHGDLHLLADGRVLTLARQERGLSTPDGPVRVIDHAVVVLSAAGQEIHRASLLDLLADRFPAERRRAWWKHQQQQPDPVDALQASSVELVTEPIPQLSPANVALVSVSALDLVALFDLEQSLLHWSWGGGVLERPLHATALADGHVLIVDAGTGRGHARVIEVDPRTGEEKWRLLAPAVAERASAQRLPNGNTLVTWASLGEVVEVTPMGELVWGWRLSPGDPPVGRVERVQP